MYFNKETKILIIILNDMPLRYLQHKPKSCLLRCITARKLQYLYLFEKIWNIFIVER